MIDLMFAKFWEATILTFRILGWIFRAMVNLISFGMNRRQNDVTKTTAQADLFERKSQQE